ncbi:hypothetical protein NM208_g7703 [Fusarium decemcellulare]|uniref:Uncharacterized protein n=1 Tax=Fusarium decemcellulare TaxID=57161 RepID=A0ACC1S861_9HYPO|nr:hypothetical protein NM208_g7703 [Fusarium decemcellulare]
MRLEWPSNGAPPHLPPLGEGDFYMGEPTSPGRQAGWHTVKPCEPFGKAINLTIRRRTWGEHVRQTRRMLRDMDGDMPLSVEGAVSLINMISWGLESWAAFMTRPISFTRGQSRRVVGGDSDGDTTGRYMTTDGGYTAETAMGFDSWDDLAAEMSGRRFFAGLAVFQNSTEEAFVGVVWDCHARTLQLYDVDDREKDRRRRIECVAEVWGVVQSFLGFEEPFGVHGMPVSPGPVFDRTMRTFEFEGGLPRWKMPKGRRGKTHARWSNGYIVLDLLHKTLRGLVGVGADELRHRIRPDAQSITVGVERREPPDFALLHRDWRLVGHELSSRVDEVDSTDVTRVCWSRHDGLARPHRRLAALDFGPFIDGDECNPERVTRVMLTRSEALLDRHERPDDEWPSPLVFFTELGGFQTQQLPGMKTGKSTAQHRIVAPTHLTTYTDVIRGLSALFPPPPSTKERRWDGTNVEPMRPSIDSCFFEGCRLLSKPSVDRLRQEHGAGRAREHPIYQDAAMSMLLGENPVWLVEKTHTFMTVIPPNLNSGGSWLRINAASAADTAESNEKLRKGSTRQRRMARRELG